MILRTLFFSILLICSFSFPVFGQAATLFNDSNVIGGLKESVMDDVYITANQIAVSGEIEGDLLAVGIATLLTGPVSGDLLAAASNIVVESEIGDDARIVGGTVMIDSSIQGDLVVIGGQITVMSGATINGDLVVTGGTVSVLGTIQGKAIITGGEVYIDAIFGGDVETRAERLLVGSGTQVSGDFTYYSEEPIVIDDLAVIRGEVIMKEPITSKEGRFFFGLFGIFEFFRVIGLMFAALLLSALFQRQTRKVIVHSQNNLWPSILFGFVGSITIPLAAFLFMATIIGLPLGLIGIFLYIFLFVSACIYSGVVLGSWFRRLVMKDELRADWKWTVIGTLLLAVLMLVPIIGWILVLLVFWLTLGTFLHMLYAKVWKNRKD